MARCRACGEQSSLTASSLGLCVGCIPAAPADLEARVAQVHARTRQAFQLPQEVPHDPSGLGCQNWHFRELSRSGGGLSALDLAERVDSRTACICYFGGDPSTQLPHAIATSVLARRRAPGRVLRICWETNGTMHPRMLRRAMNIALESGGCVKFDLKAWNDGVHRALTGCGNRRTLENFALLAFHPQCFLHDLPVTSRHHAEEALAAARAAGLTRVHNGNRHLLGER